MKYVALAAFLAACGPTVIWSGHTADRHTRIEVVEDGGLQFVVIDGQRREAYRGIAGWSVAVASDHVAFAAQLAGKWVIVHDGHTSEKWDAIGAIVLAPNGRLAFAAERASGWYVVVDGVASSRYDAITTGTLAFTSNGTHVAYVGQLAGRSQCVIDSLGDPFFDGIGSLEITPDGHYAYAARDGDNAFVVHDRVTGPRWGRITQVSVAGAHVAYAAWDETAWRVVVDGQAGAAVDRVRRILFDSVGNHVAWIGRLGKADVLALDSVPLAGGPALREDAVAFRPTAGDSPGLAYVAPTPDGGEHMVVDNAAGPTFDAVGVPVWGMTGTLAYGATRAGRSVLVQDGSVREVDGKIEGTPVFSEDGRRLAYIARRPRGSVVVDGSHETKFDFVFADTLVFSSNAKRWAVIAGDVRAEHLFFAIEGGVHVPLAMRELYSAAAQQPDDPGRLLRGWAKAEAEQASALR